MRFEGVPWASWEKDIKSLEDLAAELRLGPRELSELSDLQRILTDKDDVRCSEILERFDQCRPHRCTGCGDLYNLITGSGNRVDRAMLLASFGISGLSHIFVLTGRSSFRHSQQFLPASCEW